MKMPSWHGEVRVPLVHFEIFVVLIILNLFPRTSRYLITLLEAFRTRPSSVTKYSCTRENPIRRYSAETSFKIERFSKASPQAIRYIYTITKIDTDQKLHSPVFWQVSIPDLQILLYLHSTLYGFYCTYKLGML